MPTKTLLAFSPILAADTSAAERVFSCTGLREGIGGYKKDEEVFVFLRLNYPLFITKTTIFP
ncbi:hypothetical protein EON65_28470 [archaeon]|nr:MAG: hypothetical protein EON65_28470 [archaeon]